MKRSIFSRLREIVDKKIRKTNYAKDRSHFSGAWGRRERKESIISGSKRRISAVEFYKKKMTIKKKLNVSKTVAFMTYHFIYSEEMFYGHIAFLVILSKADGDYLTKLLMANRDRRLEVTEFKILKTLGMGSFGTVFLAKHPFRKQLVALKKVMAMDLSKHNVREALRTMVEKEATLHAGSSSPFIVKMLDSFTVRNGPRAAIYFVFEFAGAGDLANVIYRIHRKTNGAGCLDQFYQGGFPRFHSSLKTNPRAMWAAREFGAQLLLGVKAMHERGIIHQDLKPANILVTDKGVLKVSDFGTVKRYRWFHYSSRALFLNNVNLETVENNDFSHLYVGGTFCYMEPELRGNFITSENYVNYLLEFDNDVTFSADLFAVGIIISEILFGFAYGNNYHYKLLSSSPVMDSITETKGIILSAWKTLKWGLYQEDREMYMPWSVSSLIQVTGSLDKGVVNLLKSTVTRRSTRWSKYTISMSVRRDGKLVKDRIICLDKVRRNLPLFADTNFEKLYEHGCQPEKLAKFVASISGEQADLTSCMRQDVINNVKNYNQPPTSDIYEWPYFNYHQPLDDEDYEDGGFWKKASTAGTAKTSCTTGTVYSACAAGTACGTCAAGAASGACAAGTACGACAAGAASGACAAGTASGACAAGTASGACAAGTASGACAAGAASGACAAGTACGACAAGTASGACAAGTASGACAAGTACGAAHVEKIQNYKGSSQSYRLSMGQYEPTCMECAFDPDYFDT